LGSMFPDEAYRPDRLRIVFHFEEVQDQALRDALAANDVPVTSHAVCAYLFWKDVHKQKRQARVIEAFLDAGLAVCLFHTEGGSTHRRLLLPTQRDRYIRIESESSPFSSLS
ncbi:hypothetical protein IIA16_01685, partial [bacterium]|nr:hypothetical protein [bacterium]